MKILATRDDGAQLIGERNLNYALLRSDAGSGVMPVASALARGYWNISDDPADANIPQAVEDDIRQRSADF